MVCSLLVIKQWGRGGRTVLDGPAPAGAPPKGRLYTFRRRSGFSLILALALLGGCASSERAPAVHGLSEVMDSPWGLLPAAVAYAAPRHGLTVLAVYDSVYDSDVGADMDPRVRVYELLSVRDQRVLLRAEGDSIGPAPILDRIEVQWTPFRDAKREAALLATIRDRLTVLQAGGGVAPAP